MGRGKGRPASKTPTKTARTTIRMYPREQELLRAGAAKLGVSQTDYIMMLLACRPELSEPQGLGKPSIDLLRRYGFEKDHLVYFARCDLQAFAKEVSEMSVRFAELCELVQSLHDEVDLLQKATYVDATMWLSKVDMALSEAANMVRDVNDCALEIENVAAGRHRRKGKVPRAFVSDYDGPLFPRGDEDAQAASPSGGE